MVRSRKRSTSRRSLSFRMSAKVTVLEGPATGSSLGPSGGWKPEKIEYLREESSRSVNSSSESVGGGAACLERPRRGKGALGAVYLRACRHKLLSARCASPQFAQRGGCGHSLAETASVRQAPQRLRWLRVRWAAAQWMQRGEALHPVEVWPSLAHLLQMTRGGRGW